MTMLVLILLFISILVHIVLRTTSTILGKMLGLLTQGETEDKRADLQARVCQCGTFGLSGLGFRGF